MKPGDAVAVRGTFDTYLCRAGRGGRLMSETHELELLTDEAAQDEMDAAERDTERETSQQRGTDACAPAASTKES